MKFGKYLNKNKVPEWTEAYVDYNELKRILQGIHNFKQNNSHPLRTASLKGLSLLRDFSAASRHKQNSEHQEDIESQVIAVHTLQQNSRKLYNTKLLLPPEEGVENERLFFRKLDEELNKTNEFYKEKVEEVINEATLLKKQMEALIALRIKVRRPDFEGSGSLKSLSTDISNLATSKNAPPNGAKTDDIKEIDGELVKMGSRSQLEPGSSSEANLSCDEAMQSDGLANFDAPIENITDTPIDREKAKGIEKTHSDILAHVTISNTFDSPISTIKGVFKDSKQKSLCYNKEELKEVEERLKAAFVDFYQKLCLLKHYSFMNLSAFSKILKKYEKITSRSVARSYMTIVENSFIGSCDQITILMERVELIFIKNFFNSNRQKGMKLLRPKQKIEKHSITFFSGFFSGCSIALLIAVVLLIEDRKLVQKKSSTIYMDTIFPLYSFYAYIVLHMLMYAANIYFWRRYKINYPFIFGFKQGTELGYREVFLLSNGLAVIALATFLVHLQVKMDSKTQHYETYVELLPLGLVIVVLAIMFCPFNIIFRSSRFFLIKCVVRCICAPLYKVTMPDFFLADQLTSQVQATRSFEYYICFYGRGKLSQRLTKCRGQDAYNVFYFIVAVVPYWFRFLQCLRRLFEERDFAHGYNGTRYFLTIIAVVIRTAFELKNSISLKVLALVSSAIATIANTYWDIVVDWGLMQRKSKNLFLRDKHVVSQKYVYFAAMVLDILLRFAWLKVVLSLDVFSLQGNTISTVFSCLEILRRGLWNFFRLENEHLNNVGRYRAFKSVPLPFTYYEDEDEDGESNDKDD